MKVFISWSGDLSHKIALTFREWLPSVIQAIRPYVSSQDIDKGARWSTDIAKELSESTYGILCVTRDNIDAPWINFEAGALSKTIDKSFVAPFLFNIQRSEVKGPLLQFQSTIYEKEDLLKLMVSINTRAPAGEQLEAGTLKKAFEVWWPQFEGEMKKIETSAPPGEERKPKLSRQDAILEEVLELSRSQQKLLRNPEELLPPPYLDYAFRRVRRGRPGLLDDRISARLHRTIVDISGLCEKISDRELASEISREAEELHELFHSAIEDVPVRRTARKRDVTEAGAEPTDLAT
jgi:hypothetical protein